MNKTPLIKGIGKINVDLVFGGLDRLPLPGEELYSDSFDPLLGGGVPSMLYHAASFGARTELITYIGKGFFSGFVTEKLSEKGIAYRNVSPASAKDSGINVTAVMLTPGERTFVTRSEDHTASEQLVFESVKDADLVIAEYGKYAGVYEKIRAAGKPVVGDFGYSPDMDLTEMSRFLRLTDYYLPNRQEAEKLTGTDDVFSALKTLSEFVPHPVITLGAEGAAFLDNGIMVTVPVNSVSLNPIIKNRPAACAYDEIVDATGAGDAFTGGFSYGIASGADIPSAILFGHAAAAEVVMKKGCY